MSLRSLDLITRSRDKISYRLTIDRNYEGRASYEISTPSREEAQKFLLVFVKDATAKVELSITATAEDVYQLLGVDPPTWQPPKEQI